MIESIKRKIYTDLLEKIETHKQKRGQAYQQGMEYCIKLVKDDLERVEKQIKQRTKDETVQRKNNITMLSPRQSYVLNSMIGHTIKITISDWVKYNEAEFEIWDVLTGILSWNDAGYCINGKKQTIISRDCEDADVIYPEDYTGKIEKYADIAKEYIEKHEKEEETGEFVFFKSHIHYVNDSNEWLKLEEEAKKRAKEETQNILETPVIYKTMPRVITDLHLSNHAMRALSHFLGYDNWEDEIRFQAGASKNIRIDNLTYRDAEVFWGTKGMGNKSGMEIIYRVHDAGYTFDDDRLNKCDKRDCYIDLMEQKNNEEI